MFMRGKQVPTVHSSRATQLGVSHQTYHARARVTIHGSRVTIFCGDPAHLGVRRPAWDPTTEHDEGTILHVDSQMSADTPRPPTMLCRPEPRR